MATAAAIAAEPPHLNICTILTESKRIINAYSRHFLALSVLFLLPLSFSLTVYPTLQNLLTQSTTHNSKIFLSTSGFFLDQDPSDFITVKTLILCLSFLIFVSVFSLLSVGSITYSVLHGFYGRPVKLKSAIRSAFASFLRVLVTILFVEIIVSAIFLGSGFLLFLVIKGVELAGFQVQFHSPYFIGFSVIVSILLALMLVYLQLNWSLATVVAVVESSWGLAPLKRSCFLIQGMRKLAFALLLFFGFLMGILLFLSSISGVTLGIGTTDGWKSCASILQIVVTSTLLMLLLLYNVASNTILYMYCKAIQGELAWEIAEEFAREYVSLPFDDGKVPHLVSVVYT